MSTEPSSDSGHSDRRGAPNRRELLAASGTLVVSSLAGCSRLSTNHARLVGITLENGRTEQSTMSVRVRNAETEETVRNYRLTVEAFDERPYPQLELDCEWPFRDPLVVTTDLLADGSAVADTRTVDTRELDGGCTVLTFVAQSNDEVVLNRALTACDEYDGRVEACAES